MAPSGGAMQGEAGYGKARSLGTSEATMNQQPNPPTTPERYAALRAVMARVLALAWCPRQSARRCVRARQQRMDAGARVG